MAIKEPVTGDGGYDAWQVQGIGGIGYYYKPVDYSAAFVEGWRITARMRLVSGTGAAGVGLNPGGDKPRFDVHLSASGADAVISLFGSSLSYTVSGGANAWHLVDLVYDPTTARANLLIDGVERLTGYEGTFYANENRGLLFGTDGPVANFNLARFKTGMGDVRCTLDHTLEFDSGTLTMGFELGAAEATTWNMWLNAANRIFSVWSVSLPVVDPAVSFSIDIPGFPSVGKIGFLTTLVAGVGIICSDFEVVDTGAPAARLTRERMLELLRTARIQ